MLLSLRLGILLPLTVSPALALPTEYSLFPDPLLEAGTRAAAAGDVDGDGRVDLLVASGLGLSVYLSNGDRTFEPAAGFPLGGTYDLALGDLDGDGNLDAAAVDRYTDYVAVALGNGDGTFGPPALYPVPYRSYGVAMTDLGADGIVDVVVTNWTDASVSVLAGNGDGTLAPEARYPVGPEPYRLGVGDLNEDGNPDLVVALSDFNDGISVLLGNADGTLAPEVRYPVGLNTLDVALDDFDGDGHVDVVALNNNGASTISPGNGDGTLGAPSSFTAPFWPIDVLAAHVDADGHADLLVAADEEFAVLRGRGDGSFDPPVPVPLTGAAYALVAEDLDQDGFTDVAALTADSPLTVPALLDLRFGDGTGAFPQTRTWVAAPAGAGDAGVLVLDVDGDGFQDLVSAGADVSILLGRGDGTFDPEIQQPVVGGVDEVVSADFDGDGVPDLAASSPAEISVLLGAGDGTFLSSPSIAAGGFLYGITAGDLDDDGHEDLVSLEGSNVAVLLGAGDGTFSPGGTRLMPATAFHATTGDLDSDGDADVVAIRNSDLWVLLSNGDGTLAAPVSYSVDAGQTDVAIVDLNGDTFPDVILDPAVVLLGNGDGTLAAPSSQPAGASREGLAVADLDLDGLLDVATSGSSGDTAILFGDGTGSFGNLRRFGTEGGSVGIAAGDLDGDGAPELVLANPGTASLLILPNLRYQHPCSSIFQDEDEDRDGFSGCIDDCDDLDPAFHPGAPELCDGLDNDCDSAVPASEVTDADSDGAVLCADCDDDNPFRYPGNVESCDNIDNDCDSIVDAMNTTCGTGACAAGGFCAAGVDSCVPGSPSAEVCDALDNDCDGALPLAEQDVDGDGVMSCAGDCDDAIGATFPGAPETNDGLDNQCPGDPGFGLVDEVTGLLYMPSMWQLCWPLQPGASTYQALLSDTVDLGSCSILTTAGDCVLDLAEPALGTSRYYVVRAYVPWTGSWGASSSGNERFAACGAE